MSGDESLYGSLFPEFRKELVELGAEEGPAPHIFGSCVLAALKDEDIQPRFRHDISRGASRGACPNYDRIKLFHGIPFGGIPHPRYQKALMPVVKLPIMSF